MDNQTIQRADITGQLTRFHTYLTTVQADYDATQIVSSDQCSQINERLLIARPLLAEYAKIHTKIIQKSGGAEAHLDNQAEFENSYYSAMTLATRLLNTAKPDANSRLSDTASCSNQSAIANNSCSNHSAPFIKLPTINLAKFNGDSENWIEFREIFNDLIHTSETLTEVQKLHYLPKGESAWRGFAGN